MECGRILSIMGRRVVSQGPPCRVGELLLARAMDGLIVRCLVEGFEGYRIHALALDDPRGLACGGFIQGTGSPPSLAVGPHLAGRLFDGMGCPLDGGPPLQGGVLYPTTNCNERRLLPLPLKQRFLTGVRGIDTLMPWAAGQRIYFHSLTSSPMLPTRTLAMVVRHCAARVVVVGLVGICRNRLSRFLDDLGPGARSRTTIFAATADQNAGSRYHCPYAACAAAEYFRDQGQDVLLVLDCLQQWQEASWELKSKVPSPTRIAQMVERAGPRRRGSITGIYSVRGAAGALGENLDELSEGRVRLTAEMESLGVHPPIDVLDSYSESTGRLLSSKQLRMVSSFRYVMRYFQRHRELIRMGAFFKGLSEAGDHSLERVERCWRFLIQNANEPSSEEEDFRRLKELGLSF